jgi:hypothetical protein
MRRHLVAPMPAAQPMGVHLAQYDWVVRMAVLKNHLSVAERDRIEQRLLVTLNHVSSDPYATLQTALEATQLLDVIGRPVDRGRYRPQIHELLREFHDAKGNWAFLAGGFKPYRKSWTGSLEATAQAVELMEIYGVPEGLDLIWVRSFLRPLTNRKLSEDQWIAAATLDRLNHLREVRPPTWLEVLYYERTLLAAAVLVGLCLYATYISPPMKHPQGN